MLHAGDELYRQVKVLMEFLEDHPINSRAERLALVKVAEVFKIIERRQGERRI